MKRTHQLLLMVGAFLLASTEMRSQVDTWVLKDSIKGPSKYGCVAFELNGDGWLGLGYDNSDYKRSFYSYDPGENDWDREESLGGVNGSGLGRNLAVGFEAGGKAYVGTGQGAASFYGDFWEFDPTTQQWTIMTNVGVTSRRAAVAFSIDDIGYVGTGYDANGYKKDFWKYDPSNNTWTQVANYGGTARQKAVAVSMGGKGYVGLGDDGVLKDDFWVYTPSTNSWSPISNFAGGARSGACGFAVGASIYVGTGVDFSTYKQDFYQYNYYTANWVAVQDFGGTAGTPRAHASAFSLGNIGYVGAGYDGFPRDDFFSFEPAVGINELNPMLYNSTLYPNPVVQHFNINLDTDIPSTNLTIEAYSITGQNVSSKIKVNDISRSGTNTNLKLSNLGLSKGQYIYNIQFKNQIISVGKFIVHG